MCSLVNEGWRMGNWKIMGGSSSVVHGDGWSYDIQGVNKE